METLTFLTIILFCGLVLYWYITNLETHSNGEKGLLGLIQDSVQTVFPVGKRYRHKGKTTDNPLASKTNPTAKTTERQGAQISPLSHKPEDPHEGKNANKNRDPLTPLDAPGRQETRLKPRSGNTYRQSDRKRFRAKGKNSHQER